MTKVERLKKKIEEARVAYSNTKSDYFYKKFVSLQVQLKNLKRNSLGKQLNIYNHG